jgi:2-isopropylmalate synthase
LPDLVILVRCCLGNRTYVETLDTTLRDGAQSTDVSFTLKDKVRIAQALDELGADYIEGGWPGSNPKDRLFFEEIAKCGLSGAKVAAFGSTLHKDSRPESDANLNSIIDSRADVAVIFGKSWLLHVRNVLNVDEEANLGLVYDSVSYLKAHGLKVIFDAEHFYQGFLDNHLYALAVIDTANRAGSDTVVLCDTNGGTLPRQIGEITRKAAESVGARIGIHAHNDCGCAVANTLTAVMNGATHVQGTINGLGERTGNADLVQVLPSLKLKMGMRVLMDRDISRLRDVSSLVYLLSGRVPSPFQPFVGSDAFAHKGGIHADAVLKDPSAYEHISPESVGNTRKIIISELSGTGSLAGYAKAHGVTVSKSDERVKEALRKVKALEKSGYSFDIAPESAFLVLAREVGIYREFVDLKSWKVTSDDRSNSATVEANGVRETSQGTGPVDAIDSALRKALKRVYPELSKIRLTDYRVILPEEVRNTASVVRVTVEFSDGAARWRTMGVSRNIIDASVKGLLDGLNYYLWKSRGGPRG